MHSGWNGLKDFWRTVLYFFISRVVQNENQYNKAKFKEKFLTKSLSKYIFGHESPIRTLMSLLNQWLPSKVGRIANLTKVFCNLGRCISLFFPNVKNLNVSTWVYKSRSHIQINWNCLHVQSKILLLYRALKCAVYRAGHFRYFWILSIIKNYFCIFYHVNLTGSGLFKYDWCRNRLFKWKKAKIIFFIEKNIENSGCV